VGEVRVVPVVDQRKHGSAKRLRPTNARTRRLTCFRAVITTAASDTTCQCEIKSGRLPTYKNALVSPDNCLVDKLLTIRSIGPRE